MRTQPAARRAFTLIEVLLTTVLAAVLLVALWSLLSMYSKAFESGQSQTQQAQLARTLLEQMQADLQGAVHPPPPVPPLPVPPLPSPDAALASTTDSGSSSASSSGASSSTSNSSTSVTTPVQAVVPIAPTATIQPTKPTEPTQGAASGTLSASINRDGELGGPPAGLSSEFAGIATFSLRPAGVFGTEDYLQIDVVQPVDVDPNEEPEPDLPSSFSRDEPRPSRAAELKTIVYSFAELRDSQGSPGEREACLIRRERNWEDVHPAARSAGRGLASRGGAGSALESALPEDSKSTDEELTEEDDFADDTVTRVPEVLSFAVRYFDGAEWLTEWDSVAMRRLPVAVEVTLQLRAVDEQDPFNSDEPIEPGIDMEKLVAWKHPPHRLVIPIKSGTAPPPDRDPLRRGAPDALEPGSLADDDFALGGESDAP